MKSKVEIKNLHGESREEYIQPLSVIIHPDNEDSQEERL